MNTIFNKLASIYENEDDWEYGKSDIEGIGILANREIPAHTIIGKATEPYKDIPRVTPMGTKINHSSKPNCYLNRIGSDETAYHNFVTSWEIESGEELTVDYSKYPEFKDPDPNWN